jgi:S-adenosyl-L-methionine hydrolase (adenosine-forming)
MAPLITLTTDFGEQDGFVGTMKGVIWGICPGARLADITHQIPAQDIRAGAIALWRAAPYFPAGTVHIAVVDPGVGTDRRPLGLRLGPHFFVGPDNGLFTPLIQDAFDRAEGVEFFHLDNPAFWLPRVSQTFHGRDIFSPVGAHLANGVPLAEMGTPISDPVRLPLLRPERTRTGWSAHVTVIDRFGNLTLDLRPNLLGENSEARFRVHGREISGLAQSYGHRKPGELVALVDSEDFVEIAVVNGSAARELDAKIGDLVEVVVEDG